MKPRIVNVIEVIENSVSSVESFIVNSEAEEAEQVKKAEELFVAKCKEQGVGDEGEGNFEDCLEDGYFAQGDYYVCITWSDVK